MIQIALPSLISLVRSATVDNINVTLIWWEMDIILGTYVYF